MADQVPIPARVTRAKFSAGAATASGPAAELPRRTCTAGMTPGEQAAIVASAQDWALRKGGDRKSDQLATLPRDRPTAPSSLAPARAAGGWPTRSPRRTVTLPSRAGAARSACRPRQTS